MRPAVLAVPVLLALLASASPVLAASETGSTPGLHLGYGAVGVWDLWKVDHPGGTLVAGLSWEPFFPLGADYDLHLYGYEAPDDGRLDPDEVIAKSDTRTFAPHDEGFSVPLPEGPYYLAVVPIQAQGEVYTLSTEAGSLFWAGTAVGVVGRCPGPFCGLPL